MQYFNKVLEKKSTFGAKANISLNVQVGKWYKFDTISGDIGYGKVVEVKEDGKSVVVEKYFELPSYRPYAETKWYDKLPYAVYED